MYEYPVIKEETEGYALVVADSRIPAVLTFIDDGSLADTLEIEPLNLYIKGIPQLIEGFLEDYYSKSEETLVQTRAAISRQGNVNLRSDTIGGNNIFCHTLEWGQGPPYNANCPVVTSTACPNGVPSDWGGRYLVGCVPLAIGEIIKYHIDKGWKPNVIQSQFGNSIAAFLADIGDQVYVEYGCSGSGAYSLISVIPAFFHYGYTNDIWQYFSPVAVEASLLSGYPVYIRGNTPSGPPDYNAGHAWVIDGQTEGDYYYFHMNWGWYGLSNGYFNCGIIGGSPSGSLTAGGHNFVFSTFQILTNIH